jgi:phage minor structural protein
MIKILDQSRQPLAILQNAYNISYEKRINEVPGVSFTLPLNDPKNAECQPLNFVQVYDDLNGDYLGLFRILPSLTKKDESADEVTYECDHVLSTLLDSVLFRYHQTTNRSTRQTIEYILDKQTVKHWKLGICDFTRYFSYSFENESSLLGPLFSIPEPFDVHYEWTFDTSTYPWTLNLISPSNSVTCEIRYAKNQKSIERTVDPTGIVNRIYPLGAGEGVNQLTIEKINAGKAYLEDTASISKYGPCSYVWVDRRFTNAESLKANAQTLLNKWKEPTVSYRVSAVDLSLLTGVDADRLKVGRIVRIVDPDLGTIEARIVSQKKKDIVGAPDDTELEIANKSEDLGTTQADIERRQHINEVYSQGATNIDSHSFSDNCDAQHPAVIRFWLPDDLVNVNELRLTFETTKFRAYSKAAETTATKTNTTTSGGGSTVTSSSGGGTTVSSSAGGGVSTTSGFASPGFYLYSSTHLPNLTYDEHIHAVEVTDQLNHSHSIVLNNHSHSVTISPHSHSITIAPHSHDLEIPGHGHSLVYGVYEHDTLPTSITVKVDGTTIAGTSLNRDAVDIIPYLARDSDGKVTRGAWHTVELVPNNLARINAVIISRLFIQSQSGGNY